MQIKEQDHFEDDEDFIVLPELSEEEHAKMQSEHRQRLELFYTASKNYAMENWYGELERLTFKSISFTITNIEAYYLSSLYHEETLQLNKPQMKDAEKSLIKKVDDFIKEHFPQGCFMKLSTRSPKDRGWDYRDETTKNQQVKKLLSLLQGKVNHLDNTVINKIYRYFLQQSKDKLKVTSAEQFINIFSHSDRIQIDINDMAYIQNNMFGRFSQDNYQHSNQPFIGVWGRQWVDFSWMEEFRCFYNNYTLTAITQYDQRCFFPQLQSKQEQIKSKICELFENAKPHLKKLQLSKGVMDVIVKFDSDHDPILIQINIFDQNSRGSLFSWEKDRKIIEEGPLSVRILTEEKDISKWELTKMMGMIQKGIESVIDEVMKKLGLQQQWQKYE